MDLDDLEREINKVTQQGGIARVPEATVLESMTCESEAERREEMEEWIQCMCRESHLERGEDKDMFGLTEMLFFHGTDYHGRV